MPLNGPVLLVEDADRHAVAVRVALGGRFELDHVRDVEAALAALAARRYTAVICDWHVGEVTGERVLRAARAITPPLWCVVYSGDVVASPRALAAGAAHFVLKGPEAPRKLAELLAELPADRIQ